MVGRGRRPRNARRTADRGSDVEQTHAISRSNACNKESETLKYNTRSGRFEKGSESSNEVDIDEGERLFLEQSLRWIPEGVSMARNDGSIFTFDDIERNEGEKGLVDGDGPTVVTGGPVASMATLPFVPKVQVGLLVKVRFTNLNLKGDLIKSPITVGSPINFKWQNKDNIMVAKNAQRKGDEASK
nr:hypothetical protein [Tanacetum cinerariifolium]